MTSQDIIRKLSEPFPVEQIEFRVGATFTRDGQTNGLALAYAETRAYQDRLDKVFGPGNWSTEIRLISDTVAVSTLIVRFPDGNEVTRQATGEDTDVMSVEARAFKRACSSLGIGRYLYSVPSPWAPVTKRGKASVFDDDTQERLRAGLRKWMNANGVSQPPTNGASNGESNGAALTNGTTPRTNNAKPADDEERERARKRAQAQAKAAIEESKRHQDNPFLDGNAPSDNKEAEEAMDAIVGIGGSRTGQGVGRQA